MKPIGIVLTRTPTLRLSAYTLNISEIRNIEAKLFQIKEWQIMIKFTSDAGSVKPPDYANLNRLQFDGIPILI